MKLASAVLVLALGTPVAVQAQSARFQGRLLDRATHVPVAGAYVKLVSLADTTDVRAGGSKDDGGFAFVALKPGAYRFSAERIGYETLRQPVRIDRDSVDAGTLFMASVAVPQSGIVVQASPPPAVQKADTTEYAAQAFKTNPDATAEDLVTKLPGITVDNSGVKANGEAVKQVLVDGKPFFGGDPTIALRNLPADVIDKIQVYDQMSDQSQFTGFDDGQSVRTMNVSLRNDRRRAQFGKVYAGHGDRRHYQSGGNESFVRGPRRWSLLGLANNINQQNFSSQDLLGVLNAGGGGQRGGAFGGAGEGRRFGAGGGRNRGAGGGGSGGGAGGAFGGGGGGFGGAFGGNAAGPGSFLVGPQDGLTETAAGGTNFTGPLSSALQLSGSTFFNRTDNHNDQLLAREYAPPLDSIALYGQSSRAATRNDNLRFDSRLEWNPDSSNALVFQPRLYFQRNRSNNALEGMNTDLSGAVVNHASNDNDGTTSGNNLSGHLIGRHKFATRGRTISIDLGAGGTLRDNTGGLHSEVEFPESAAPGDTVDEQTGVHTTTRTLSVRAVYTEPFGAHALLQLFVAPSGTLSRSRSSGFLLDPATGEFATPDSAQTNTFENRSVASSGGLGLLMRRGGLNLMANVALQRSVLRSEQTFPRAGAIERTFHNVLPSVMLNWNAPDKSNLRISFNTSTRPPSVNQLQNVVDTSNPLILTNGNPSLEQSTSQSLVARYSRTAPLQSRSTFLVLSLQHTGGSIANQTITALRDTVVQGGLLLRQGTQLVTPVNLEGAWNASSFVTWSRPLGFLKSIGTISSGVSYARTPGLIGAVETASNTWALNPGATLASNISPNLDFTLTYNGTYHIARNTNATATDGDYYTHSVGLKINVTTWNGVVFRDEVSNALTSGVAGGYDQNTVLWNTSVAKKFFKDDRGELRLGAADVLDQDRSTHRTVTETYIQDARNRTLGQYVMLTFTYTLR